MVGAYAFYTQIHRDISDDDALLVTASADKNIKVWGMDFGDCHKSFFAHDAAVMAVRFVPKTHYFFSAAKDGRVRYWPVLALATTESVHHV